jgi:hypothetical protein
MRAKLLAVAALMLILSALSACYPSFLTSRPEAEIIVTDESGTPLEGARVILGTMERHGPGGRVTRQDFQTNREGKAGFDQQYEWHTQILLPDGDVSYSWALCVSRPGFEAVPVLSPKFHEPIKVRMYPSAASSECEWQPYDSWPRVKEREARWFEVAGGAWQSNIGITMILDQDIRDVMEASAREQGIQLHSWSEYRFQYLTGGDELRRDSYILIRALCRAPEGLDLTRAFYSEPDGGSCFFETKYTRQVWADQPKPSFGPLRIVAGKT